MGAAAPTVAAGMGTSASRSGDDDDYDDDAASSSSPRGGGGGDDDSPRTSRLRRDSTPLLASAQGSSVMNVERGNSNSNSGSSSSSSCSSSAGPTPETTAETTADGRIRGAVRYRRPTAEEVRRDARAGRDYAVPRPCHPDDASAAPASANCRHRATALGRLVLRYFRGRDGDDDDDDRGRPQGPTSYQDRVSAILPCCRWLQAYQWRTTLWKDVIAGVTVGIMVIPQGMVRARTVQCNAGRSAGVDFFKCGLLTPFAAPVFLSAPHNNNPTSRTPSSPACPSSTASTPPSSRCTCTRSSAAAGT
jgi:hypothetical protein